MYLVPQSADNVTNKGVLISQPDDAKRTMSRIHKDREVTKSARVRSLKITQRKTYRRYLYVFTEYGQFVILINAIGIKKGKFHFFRK